jgi:hypothetical protein
MSTPILAEERAGGSPLLRQGSGADGNAAGQGRRDYEMALSRSRVWVAQAFGSAA